MFSYQLIPPHPALAPYVRSYWILEAALEPGQPYTHRTMADGCAEMVFHFKGRFTELYDNHSELSFYSGIHGQSGAFRRFLINESFGIFGVYLYPYALWRLFRLQATDLSNQMPDLGLVLGSEGKIMEERMMLAATHQARIELLNHWLLEKVKRYEARQPPVFKAIQEIILNRNNTNVQKMATDHFLSVRQFERNFKQYAGLSPKLFSRIIRFQQALNNYGKGHSLTDIAYQCGYYDQAHFIHDFKTFSGYNPAAYFSGNNEATQYFD